MDTVVFPYFPLQIIYKNFMRNVNHQSFPFPWIMMIHIRKNPSTAKTYLKLIKSCKHFFIKNPLIITDCLYFDCNRNCNFQFLFFKYHYGRKPLKDIPHKIWVTRELHITGHYHEKTSAAALIPRLYQCDVTTLDLTSQSMSYNQMKCLSSNVHVLYISCVDVKYDDGSEVAFEKIIELFPKLGELTCGRPNISKDTATSLIKIPHFRKLQKFELNYGAGSFDIQTFYNYHKTEKSPTITSLHFCRDFSPSFVQQATSIAEDIIKNYSKMAPIYLDGIQMPREKKLFKIYNKRLENYEHGQL